MQIAMCRHKDKNALATYFANELGIKTGFYTLTSTDTDFTYAVVSETKLNNGRTELVKQIAKAFLAGRNTQ